MAKKKKEPEAPASANGSIDEFDVLLSGNDDTTKSLINQGILPDFKDFREEDPIEPDNPKEVKGKYWCFVLYPESAPANWREILNRSGMAWCASPLHDLDLNADGGKKKAHYHMILIWENSTTYAAVKRFTHGTLNATVPQVLHSPVGYYRYFTHADNPEKAQYDPAGIESGNGFDIADYAKMTRQQKLEMHMKLTQMVMDSGIEDYSEAIMMAMSLGFDEYEMLTTHTIHFTALCKSIHYRRVQLQNAAADRQRENDRREANKQKRRKDEDNGIHGED